MDNLLNDELYYEKLNPELLNTYIEKIQSVMYDLLIEKNNYELKHIYTGFKTVTHVITNIFINTKNINITMHYGKLAITYFLEFINQIRSNNVNNFINLSLNDAIIFVYKKTIFNLNSEYKKRYSNTEDDKLFHTIFTINNIINSLYVYNDFNTFKLKTFINQLVIISHQNEIGDIEKIINLLVNNNTEHLKICNLIMMLSKKKNKSLNINKVYTFNYVQNYTNKLLVNHLIST
jgi:hypothetical protein